MSSIHVDSETQLPIYPNRGFAIHAYTCIAFVASNAVMRTRNSQGFASRADARESDSDSQAFLILCELPYHRCFLRGVGTVHL